MWTRAFGFLAVLAFGTATAAQSVPADEAKVRVAVLKFGTVNWELDTIRHHGLDRKFGFELEVIPIAGKQSAAVMLQGREADMIVSDWVWVARQRAEGKNLSFIPYSRAVGGMVVPADSPIRSLADLKGMKIGIAGGPVDKSWILIQALAKQRHGIDLAREAEPVFGAPPLLMQKALSGELDAVVNFWHFLAKMEAAGMRRLVDVAEVAGALGLDPDTPLLGYVFHEDWASANPALVKGMHQASMAAKQILARSDAEWDRLRPIMNAKDDAAFAALRAGFRAGIPSDAATVDLEAARRMFSTLAELGGEKLVGDAKDLAPGVFYVN